MKTELRALNLLTLEEFVTQPAVVYHIRRLIPAGAIILVFGPPKSGKTFAVCDLAMHAAHGMNWHGCRIAKPLRVGFLAGEGINGMRIRLRAWLSEHGPTEKAEFRLLSEAFSLPQYTYEAIESLRTFSPELIVIDTVNAFFGCGDENSTQDMTMFTAAVRRLRDDLRCSVMLIHHTGHTDATRERGSSVLRGAADVIAQVARDESGTGLIGFQVIGARDLEPWNQAIALRLRGVDTDWMDEDGVALATCVVEAANQPVIIPGRGGKPLGDRQKQLVKIVHELSAAIR